MSDPTTRLDPSMQWAAPVSLPVGESGEHGRADRDCGLTREELTASAGPEGRTERSIQLS
jgi:hypothetical protein